MSDENTIHIRLLGGIVGSKKRYVATGQVSHGGGAESREGLLGEIQYIVEDCAQLWLDNVDEPDKIEAIELTLEPIYMDILTQADVNRLLDLAPEGEVRLRYSNTPRDHRDSNE